MREDQGELWREMKELRISQEQLHSSVDNVKQGLDGLRCALDMSFEEYVASFIEFLLFEQGFENSKVAIRKAARVRG